MTVARAFVDLANGIGRFKGFVRFGERFEFKDRLAIVEEASVPTGATVRLRGAGTAPVLDGACDRGGILA